MCGIVGYVGFKDATPLLLRGLKKLEYRGYDSAGIAVCQKGKIEVLKETGRISELENLILKRKTLEGKVGIGHTRWATHGKPNAKNAHPHLSQNSVFAVVHNGIIENYHEIKTMLEEKGKIFLSETDTEVITQLSEYYYNGDLLNTMKKVADSLVGSYAISIVCKDYPDTLIAIRKDNPLIIGLGDGENFTASDITAIIDSTRNVIRLDDNEIALITKDEVKIYDKNLKQVDKNAFFVDWDISCSEKGEFEHFMLKEILEQPKAIKETIEKRIVNEEIVLDDFDLSPKEINSIDKIFIVGCGSAYHVGCISKYIFEKILKKPVEVEIASEFRYKSLLITKSSLVIAISQSGETADTLAAIREAKKLGAKIISVVNVKGSSIANESDKVFYTYAGPEIAVATTKAYSTQISVMYLLLIYLAKKVELITPIEYKKYIEELRELPLKIQEILNQKTHVEDLASKFSRLKNIFFIGRNIDYAVVQEGSLKVKEISYIHSEAYAAGELKHGTISLIEEGTLVVALATNEKLYEKMMSNIKEVKARGAVVLLIANQKNKQQVADYEIHIPKTSDIMLASLAVIPLQLFAYYVAREKDCDIDKPRNLAKSVTVE